MTYPLHPLVAIFPPCSPSEFAELVEDIQTNGLQFSITLYRENGQDYVLDGRHRLEACEQAGVEPHFTWYTGNDPARFVVSANLRRRHLNTSQRAMVAARLANLGRGSNQYQAKTERVDGPIGLSTPEPVTSQADAAERMNVSPRSVKRAGVVESEGILELVEAVDAGEVPVSAAALIARSEPEEQVELLEERRRPHVANNSGQNEWYTPQEIIDLARSVMGTIALDPASSDAANEVVQANRYVTIEDDGLVQDWKGRVWMNPPYAQPLVAQFCERLVEFYESGNVEEARALVNNATETIWWQLLAQSAAAVSLPKGRVRFWGPIGQTGAPLQGQRCCASVFPWTDSAMRSALLA